MGENRYSTIQVAPETHEQLKAIADQTKRTIKGLMEYFAENSRIVGNDIIISGDVEIIREKDAA